MGIVTYGQSGYVGCSMSENAAMAYADGEKPKSKWTKRAMLEAIEAFADDYDVVMTSDLRKMRKADLFERYFYKSSWHHTSKFANPTDFYDVSEESVLDDCRPMTDDEVADRDRAKAMAAGFARLAAERNAAERSAAARRRRAEAREARVRDEVLLAKLACRLAPETFAALYSRWGHRTAFPGERMMSTPAALVELFPDEYERAVSRNGNPVIRLKANPARACGAEQMLLGKLPVIGII